MNTINISDVFLKYPSSIRNIFTNILQNVGNGWNNKLLYDREDTLNEKWSYYCCKRLESIKEEITIFLKKQNLSNNEDIKNEIKNNTTPEDFIYNKLKEGLKIFFQKFTLSRLKKLGLSESDFKVKWIINKNGPKYYMGDENDLYFQLNKDAYMIIGFDPDKIKTILKFLPNQENTIGRVCHDLIYKVDKLCRTNKHACYPWDKIYELYKSMDDNLLQQTLTYKYGCKIENGYFYLMYQKEIESYLYNIFTKKSNYIKTNIRCDVDPDQNEAVNMMLSNYVSILTGGPGTGKTKTLIRAVKEIDKSMSYLIFTPTGKACLNIIAKNEISESNVMTCHKYIVTNMDVINNDDKKDILIIFEESSMLSNELVAHVLKNVKKSYKIKHLIFVGDNEQLQPIQWGDFFNNIIHSNKIPMKKLEKNYRSGCESIIKNIENVKNYDSRFVKDKNTRLIRLYGEDEIVDEMNYILKKNQSNILDTKIICTKNKDIGKLNNIARNYFLNNPKKPDNDYGWYNGSVVRITDNFYNIEHKNKKINLMNGEEGIIVKCDNNKLIVNFGDDKNDVEIIVTKEKYKKNKEDDSSLIGRSFDDPYPIKIKSKDDLTTYYLKESFACTVHTSQGSEWKNVIYYQPEYMKNFTTKNLYYTAISRACENLTVMINLNFLKTMISKDGIPKDRYDNMCYLLSGIQKVYTICSPKICEFCNQLYEDYCRCKKNHNQSGSKK
jgi:hypothetical protein